MDGRRWSEGGELRGNDGLDEAGNRWRDEWLNRYILEAGSVRLTDRLAIGVRERNLG